MEVIKVFLEQQPIMALFVTIALGYLLGEINIKGFSLGVGAVLFVALFMGWFVPNAVPAAMVGSLGLALFLYTVGVQYGTQFFVGLTSAHGRRANLLALSGVLLAGVMTLIFVKTIGINLGYGLGLFAGSGTSTPSLQAAIEALRSNDPAMGYSVSYPFGVAGPILFLYLASLMLKPKFNRSSANDLELREVRVRNDQVLGKTVAEIMTAIPAGVQLVALRRNGRTGPVSATSVVAANDVLLAVADDPEALDRVTADFGEAAPGHLVKDRTHVDYLRVFASRPAVIGRALSELDLPGDNSSAIIQVRRGDTDLMARSDLVLEFGDRVGLLANRQCFADLRKFFGDSIKGTAEFSYISIGVGMALGFLLGATPLPLPGLGSLRLGLAGVLIVALVLGKLRRTRGMNWTIPLSANLVLRNLGLTLFLAQVGMSSGPTFAATITQTGLLMLGLGALVLAALIMPVMLLSLFVYQMSFDEVAGIVAGACGNPAILAYSNKLAPTDQPDLEYATIYPATVIVKILFVIFVAKLA